MNSSTAWRGVATGEEAAVYGYGVLAAQLDGEERNRAVSFAAMHARARDRARAQLAQLDENPGVVGAFEIPFTVDSPESAARLAILLEDRLVDVYCTLAPQVESGDRQWFVENARESAARAVRWGQAPAAFPGSPEQEKPDAAPSASQTAPAPAPQQPTAPASGSDGATVQ